jgi:hypothetical protein
VCSRTEDRTLRRVECDRMVQRPKKRDMCYECKIGNGVGEEFGNEKLRVIQST